MHFTSIARSVFRLPYAAARTPLAVLDTRLLGRLPDSSRVKMSFARGLTGLDAAAGRLLGEPQLEERGNATSEPATHSQSATPATAKTEAARTKRSRTTRKDSSESEGPHTETAQAERERIADALLEENGPVQHLGGLAEADLEARELAELRAKHMQAEQAEQARAKERRSAADNARSTASEV
jgi:hypothetical protein